VRFLLGVAEAGLVPGVVLYLTYWFPKAWLSRATGLATSSAFVAFIIGGPLASLILTLDGIGGISGWQWLFLLEGVPPLFLALAVLKFLPDRPPDASWLSQDEKAHIADHLVREDAEKESDLLRALRDPRVLLLGLAHGCYLFALYGLGFWIPLVIQGMGFSNGATGLLTGLIYVLALPAMYLWARSSDYRGERIWHAAIAAVVISASLAVAAAHNGDWVGLVALAIAAMGSGAWLGPFFSLPRLFLGGPALAGGIALVVAISNLIGGFAGQYLIGLLREQSGSYTVPFAAASIAALLAAIIVLFLRRPVAQHVPRQTVLAE
jgi:MFS transporter, ACS family, tartrate transporter